MLYDFFFFLFETIIFFKFLLYFKLRSLTFFFIVIITKLFSSKLSTSEQTNKTKVNESAARAHPWRGFWLRVTNTFQLPFPTQTPSSPIPWQSMSFPLEPNTFFRDKSKASKRTTTGAPRAVSSIPKPTGGTQQQQLPHAPVHRSSQAAPNS